MKSPHRLRGDPSECWKALLFGEILRALDAPAQVRDDPAVKLPKTGRWETGLARLRPALDDALGATAFAVAWRWASAEAERTAWPSLAGIARKAVDHPIEAAPIQALARVDPSGVEIREGRAPEGGRTWTLLAGDARAEVSVTHARAADWGEVDRVADIVAAWLDCEWTAA